MRQSGILFPIFSLPSKYGIGCFSKEAFEFVDFLERSGQSCWQILPIGPTGYGDSPYQPLSAFAGNPYFIAPDALIEEGLLILEDCQELDFGQDQEKVDYGALYENRYTLLRKAYARFAEREAAGHKADETSEGLKADESSADHKVSDASADHKIIKQPTADKTTEISYEAFLKKEAYWLEDYALFMVLKNAFQGAPWSSWEEELRTRKPEALAQAREKYADEIGFYCFMQYMFARQWNKLRSYAAGKQISIIGDIPFYVSLDSVDVWAHPEAFQMDKDLTPTVVAGCAPDAFSPTGQLWGNPIYDWKELKKNGYDWWVHRIQRNYEFYDVLRIDHFHGFCEYYAVPYGDKTAEKGTLEKGPGMDLFRALEKKIGTLNVIAEDLGNVTEEKVRLLEESGFPGMKILQYGFTSWDSIYLTHRHIRNCVVYTGTHDNAPTRVWLEEISDGERDFTRQYVNSMNTDYGALTWDIIREAYRSVADLCVIPLQDYLCKGRESRLNTPGTAEGNWQWRLQPNFLSDDLARSIHNLAAIYGRIPSKA